MGVVEFDRAVDDLAVEVPRERSCPLRIKFGTFARVFGLQILANISEGSSDLRRGCTCPSKRGSSGAGTLRMAELSRINQENHHDRANFPLKIPGDGGRARAGSFCGGKKGDPAVQILSVLQE